MTRPTGATGLHPRYLARCPGLPCVSRWKNRSAAFPIPILRDWLESKSREFKVKVLALALDHRGCVTIRSNHRAVATDHVDHFPLGLPHGKRRDRARQPHCCNRQGCAWVISDEFFDRSAPMNEARHLGELHPGERHRHHGRRGVLFPYALCEAIELADVTPAALECHPQMPASRESPAEPRTCKKVVDRGMTLPAGEHCQMPELHSCGRQDGGAQRHPCHTFRVLKARHFARGGRVPERIQCCANPRLCKMEGKDRHQFSALFIGRFAVTRSRVTRRYSARPSKTRGTRSVP